VVRRRRAGDTFTDPRRGVTKTLKKLFNELKIPREKRDSLTLIAEGSTVLWIAEGMPRPRYAAGCAAGPDTERFLLLEMTLYV
jgi:tRNA(Ile)-lysidine synthase